MISHFQSMNNEHQLVISHSSHRSQPINIYWYKIELAIIYSLLATAQVIFDRPFSQESHIQKVNIFFKVNFGSAHPKIMIVVLTPQQGYVIAVQSVKLQEDKSFSFFFISSFFFF